MIMALLVSVIAPTIFAFLTNRSRLKEKKLDLDRQNAVAKKAKEVASTLELATAINNAKMAELRFIAKGTHNIVNNQRKMLLKLNADLRERIARENPYDEEAQTVAVEARNEAKAAVFAQN